MPHSQRHQFWNEERKTLAGDALGVLALFVLLLATLHLPLLA